MNIYSIDLGTSYSAISCVDEDGKLTVLKKTPSVVWFLPPYEKGKACEIIVGEVAKEQGTTDPDNVVSFIKQQMGTDWEKEFFGMVFPPERVSAEILKKLVKDAQDICQKEVKDVIITCPTYFGAKERAATKTAGQIAGLNVIELLDESIAAALYYCVNKLEGDRTAIVYDLGGGTFDVAVIFIKDNRYTVVCSDGNHHLGGKLWDERIVNLIANKFAVQAGIDAQEVLNDKETYCELMLKAEKVKWALSLPAGVWKGKVTFGNDTKKIEITREEFEEATKDLLAETEKLTQAMINISKEKGIEKIDDFLLVGRSTQMPQVIEMIKEKFAPQIENEPKCFEPGEAVVKGAAIYAKMYNIRVSHRISFAMGQDLAFNIKQNDQYVSLNLINKDSVLPVSLDIPLVVKGGDILRFSVEEPCIRNKDFKTISFIEKEFSVKLPNDTEIHCIFKIRESGAILINIEGGADTWIRDTFVLSYRNIYFFEQLVPIVEPKTEDFKTY